MGVAGVVVLALCVAASAHLPEDQQPLRDMVTLPKALKPLRYVVRLQPFLSEGWRVEGRGEVEVKAVRGASRVVMHMADIITYNDTARLWDKSSNREYKIVKQEYEPSRSLYAAHLTEALREGQVYVFSVGFRGTLGEMPRGLYRSKYTRPNGEVSWVASTQFQSTDARRAFPCLDEPALKASFKVFLARRLNVTALTNTPLVATRPVEGQDGWVWDEFEESLPMSSYLVAFAITDFPARHFTYRNTSVRLYVREARLNDTGYAERMKVEGLAFFESFFRVPFPLTLLNVITPPEMNPNAMENWGLITYREDGLLYREGAVQAARAKHRVCTLVMHELAHQWLGNLVTFKWWTDLWLNEGFATYMAARAVDATEPGWGEMDKIVVERQQVVMERDALHHSHAISIPVHDPAEINEIFDLISYNKGSSVIRMMSHFLTEATLRKGLQRYLTALSYKSADQDDLWHYLTTAAHDDGSLDSQLTVKDIMDSWTLHKGFPVVSVRREADKLVVTQEKFAFGDPWEFDERFPEMVACHNQNNTHSSEHKESVNNSTTQQGPHRWWVPLSLASQGDIADTSVRLWLSTGHLEAASDTPDYHWLLVNVRQTGYYRVNYDQANWRLLARQLHHDHRVLHVTNRAQLIDDAFNLARAGLLPYSTALSVTSYLRHERSFVAWLAAFNNWRFLYDMFSRDPDYGLLRDHLLSLLLPVYNSLGFHERPTDAHQELLLRAHVVEWACRLGHEDCVARASAVYGAMMSGGEGSQISSNLASTVYCAAVRVGGEREWEWAWQHSRNSSQPSLKAALSHALSCTREPWLLARYLDLAFTPHAGVKRQAAVGVFRAVAKNGPAGHDAAWNYMTSQWPKITSYIGTTFFALPNMVDDVTRPLNTPSAVREVEHFSWVHNDNLLTARRSVAQAVELAKINAVWMATRRQHVVTWLTTPTQL